MAKVYLVTDNDIKLLLASLALEKFDGAKYVQVNPGESVNTETVMNAVHRRFNYEVHIWLDEIRK
jgi:hypothetical protein